MFHRKYSIDDVCLDILFNPVIFNFTSNIIIIRVLIVVYLIALQSWTAFRTSLNKIESDSLVKTLSAIHSEESEATKQQQQQQQQQQQVLKLDFTII